MARAESAGRCFRSCLVGETAPRAPGSSDVAVASEPRVVASDVGGSPAGRRRDPDRWADAERDDGGPAEVERPMVIAEGAAAFPFALSPSASVVAAPPTSPLPPTVTEIVRAVAIGGDGRRATVRLELGGRVLGRDAGALVVHGDGDEVAIELSLDGAVVDVERARERVSARLAQRGVRVRSFDVR